MKKNIVLDIFLEKLLIKMVKRAIENFIKFVKTSSIQLLLLKLIFNIDKKKLLFLFFHLKSTNFRKTKNERMKYYLKK